MIVRINPAGIGSYYWLKDNVKLNLKRWLSNWSVLVDSWLEINIELYINSHSVEWPNNSKLNCTFHRDLRWNLGTETTIDFLFFFSGGVKLAILWFLYTCIFLLNISCGSIHWNMQRPVIRIKARFLGKKVFYNFDDLPIFTNNEIYGTSTIHFDIFSHSFCPNIPLFVDVFTPTMHLKIIAICFLVSHLIFNAHLLGLLLYPSF